MTNEDIALGLIAPLWRAIGDEYKRKYRTTIWTQFEENLKSAAYTAKIGVFLDTLTRKLSLNLRAADTESIARVVATVDERTLLKLIRNETTLLILYVRMIQEEKKAAYKEREAERETKQQVSLFTDDATPF